MRAPRAYLAGFGTSGSLLTGAALLFILASAFIGFHGWPQVGDSPATVAVSVPRAPVGTTTSAASRSLAGTTASGASSRATALRAGGAAGPAATARSGGGHVHGGPTTLGGGTMPPGGTSPTAPGGHTGPAPSHCPASGCTSTPPVRIPTPVSGPVNHATGTVHKVLGTVKRALPVHVPSHLPRPGTGSGGAGSVVHHVGSAAGGAASTAGSAVHHLLP